MKIRDISPRLHPGLEVFPGDAPFRRQEQVDADGVCVSTLSGTAHLGAHLDAPGHVLPGAPRLDALPLDRFIGPCQVLHLSLAARARAGAGCLAGRSLRARRVLIRTDSIPDPAGWMGACSGLSADLIVALAEQGVELVGIDTPSVDPFGAPLEAHRAAAARGIVLLEGLALAEVPEGCYTLLALPLAIQGAEASPVRAVLLDAPGGGPLPGLGCP